MNGNILSRMLGLIYVGLMWHFDGLLSALTVAIPIGGLVALIQYAETVAQYTGWAGRSSISHQSPAGLIRGFAWAVLLAPALLIMV